MCWPRKGIYIIFFLLTETWHGALSSWKIQISFEKCIAITGQILKYTFQCLYSLQLVSVFPRHNMICTPITLLMPDMWFSSRLDAYTFRTSYFISFLPGIHFAILTKYYLYPITENYMRPLIYCTVQIPTTKSNTPLAVDFEIVIFLDTNLRLYPSRNSLLQTVLDETFQPVLWLKLTVTSFRVGRLFVFMLRWVVFHLPLLGGKFSVFTLSLIHFKYFWIVLLLMPVIFCIL